MLSFISYICWSYATYLRTRLPIFHIIPAWTLPPSIPTFTLSFFLSMLLLLSLSFSISLLASAKKAEEISACKVDSPFCIVTDGVCVVVRLACKTHISISSRYFHVHFLSKKKCQNDCHDYQYTYTLTIQMLKKERAKKAE